MWAGMYSEHACARSCTRACTRSAHTHVRLSSAFTHTHRPACIHACPRSFASAENIPRGVRNFLVLGSYTVLALVADVFSRSPDRAHPFSLFLACISIRSPSHPQKASLLAKNLSLLKFRLSTYPTGLPRQAEPCDSAHLPRCGCAGGCAFGLPTARKLAPRCRRSWSGIQHTEHYAFFLPF